MLPGIKIKICGMKDIANIHDVAVLNPDYMGFIFYESSPRFVGSDFIVPVDLPSAINRVGVFVNQSLSFVSDTVIKHQLHYAQLHGDESVSYCEELKNHGIKIIKVFRVDDDFDFTITTHYESVVDFFLFDTKGKNYGGNAVRFNWSLLNQYNQAVAFFLSGGIQPGNIQEIISVSSLNIHAIDVNSGVEDRPGFKNVNRISEIINQLSI